MSEPVLENGEPAEEGIVAPQPKFSWFDPHPVIVTVIVGKTHERVIFSIQKNLLTFRSGYFRDKLVDRGFKTKHVVWLPDTLPSSFAYVQNFLYTSRIGDSENMPDYATLIDVWHLGRHLRINGLCDDTIGAISEYRRVNQIIPAIPDAMERSDGGAEFTRLLLLEILSEVSLASGYKHINSSPAAGQKRAHDISGEDKAGLAHAAEKPRHSHSEAAAQQAGIQRPNIAFVIECYQKGRRHDSLFEVSIMAALPMDAL